MKNDQRKASYASALNAWRKAVREFPLSVTDGHKPRFQAFGLTPEEALYIEKNGWSLDGLPDHLRCD